MGFRMYKYVDTPCCPRCNSKKTGQYVPASNVFFSSIEMEESYYRKGQRVRIADSFSYNNSNNLYCEDCGMEWMGIVSTRYVTKEELQVLLDESGISKSEVDRKYQTGDSINIFNKKKKKPLLYRIFSKKNRSDDEDDEDEDSVSDSDDIVLDIDRIAKEKEKNISKGSQDSISEKMENNGSLLSSEESKEQDDIDKELAALDGYKRYRVIEDTKE